MRKILFMVLIFFLVIVDKPGASTALQHKASIETYSTAMRELIKEIKDLRTEIEKVK